MSTHYETLGVSEHADPAVIRAAYRALIKSVHPDSGRHADIERASAINAAFAVISNTKQRAAYDEHLQDERSRATAAAQAPEPASEPTASWGVEEVVPQPQPAPQVVPVPQPQPAP